MRILSLSRRVPYPPNRGDKITTWRIIERLRPRETRPEQGLLVFTGVMDTLDEMVARCCAPHAGQGSPGATS